jgi:hypothetical protein
MGILSRKLSREIRRPDFPYSFSGIKLTVALNKSLPSRLQCPYQK